MRRRLTGVLVLLMAGTLLAAGLGSLLVSRQAARNDATRQLIREATVFSRVLARAKTPRRIEVIAGILGREGGRVIVITPLLGVSSRLPAHLSQAELSPSRLEAGHTVTGTRGGFVFVAIPVQLTPAAADHLPKGAHAAVLLTRSVGSLGASWVYFALVSGATLVLAAAVAAWLTRRISQPLVAASGVTGRIAAGELTARVQTHAGDYPELVSLGESINAMAERLQGGRDRERQLLLSVSHDLRTPLTSIRGYAEAIEEGIAPDPAGAASVIVSESKRLERLVADLLDLARLGTDNLSLHIGPTDIGEVVRRTVEAFQPRAAGAGLELLARLPSGALFVLADPDRLAQVVSNLVENSLSFATSTVTVTVEARSAPGPELETAPEPPQTVVLLVEDNGPGIAPEDLERVFDRFYQADRGGAARRGLGLGLSIVAELTRAMGGRVRAESPIGAGGGAGPGGPGTRMVVELRPAPG